MNSTNQQIEERLQQWINTGEVPHSLLFTGSSRAPHEKAAVAFAQKLVGSAFSPDLYVYRPEGKMGLHSIEALRHFKEEVFLPPFQAKRKAFLIFSAERMLPPSANALLKTFEEPLLTSTIILISHYPEKLLLTVRSRCQCIQFQDESALEEHYLAILGPLLYALPDISRIQLLDEIAHLCTCIENRSLCEKTDEPLDTAILREMREKQEEGQEALKLSCELELLFTLILSWYRDIEALSYGVEDKLLLPGMKEKSIHWVDRGMRVDLDQVTKALDQAKNSWMRSSPLKNVLETLFLRLRDNPRSANLCAKMR